MSIRAPNGSWPIVLIAAIVLYALPAQADPAAEARAHFREGVRLFGAGEFTAARTAFEQAYGTLPNSRVLANIAACFASEGRAADAVWTYRRFLRESGPELPERARAGAVREIDRLRTSVGDLVLAVEPSGAEIRVDGAVIGTAPLAAPFPLMPGPRLLEIRSEGHRPLSRSLQVRPGEELSLAIVLQPVESPRPDQDGDQPERDLPHADVTRAEPHDDRPVVPAPSPTPVGRGPLMWAGLGLTGALAVGAAITGTLALTAKQDYDDEVDGARRRDLYDSTATLATTTDVLVDAAIVLGAATALLFLLGGPDSAAERARTRQPASAALTLSF